MPDGDFSRGTERRAGTPKRRGRAGCGSCALPFVIGAFLLIFFGGSYLGSPEADVEVSPYAAVGEIDGEPVVIAAYGYSGGRGMFQLLLEPMFQKRLAALDPHSGQERWDIRLNEELVSDMRVLAAGGGMVYIATDEGLYIRDLADGSSVAEPDQIAGLEGYVADQGNYDYDPELQLIVTMDEAGGLWTIPLGESSATPAGEDVTERWVHALAGSTMVDFSSPPTSRSAQVSPTALLTSAETATGAQTSSLRLSVGDQETPLGEETFFDPVIVLDSTRSIAPISADDLQDLCFFDDLYCEFTDGSYELAEGVSRADLPVMPSSTAYAAGSRNGFVILQHRGSSSGSEHLVSTVDLATGAIIDTVEIGGSGVGAGAGGGDHIVAPVDDLGGAGSVLIIDADGTISEIPVGEKGFFGTVL